MDAVIELSAAFKSDMDDTEVFWRRKNHLNDKYDSAFPIENQQTLPS
jgi:hypothetical protein